MRSLFLAGVFAAVPFTASAGLAISDIQAPVLVTQVDCTVIIDTAGHVADYQPHTDLVAPLDERVKEMVQAVRFEPIQENGQAVSAKVNMRVSITAADAGDDGMRLTLDHLWFPDDVASKESADARSPIILKPEPKYPQIVARARADADQIAVLRFDSTGKVVDAAIQQSWLINGRARAVDAARILNMLENAALDALRQWKVDPALMPEETRVGDGYIAYVPVKWRLTGPGEQASFHAKPGEWTLETPSTRHVPAWLPARDAFVQPGVADLASGQLTGVKSRYRLAQSAGS